MPELSARIKTALKMSCFFCLPVIILLVVCCGFDPAFAISNEAVSSALNQASMFDDQQTGCLFGGASGINNTPISSALNQPSMFEDDITGKNDLTASSIFPDQDKVDLFDPFNGPFGKFNPNNPFKENCGVFAKLGGSLFEDAFNVDGRFHSIPPLKPIPPLPPIPPIEKIPPLKKITD